MVARALLVLMLAALALPPPAARADGTTLTAAGSTALLPLLKATGELYELRHPGLKITVSGGGSHLGIEEVAAGNVDFGMSDTPAKGYPDLVDHRICVVGFSVLASPGVGVSNLSKRQLQGIFAGSIVNWNEVGGPDLKIVPLERPQGSGTRLVFDQAIMGGLKASEADPVEDGTPTLLADLRSTPGAISYAAFPGTKVYRDGQFVTVDGVREVAIDGALPSEADIGAGKYPLWSYEHVYTNGQPSREASRFLALVASNGETMHALGFMLLRDLGALH